MEKEMKKPDYTDSDWSWLIADRIGKWKTMLETVEQRGWKRFPLREEAGFTSQLILLPVLDDEPRGLFIVCAGGGFVFKSSNEALPVAEFFHARGVNAAILDYHVDSTASIGQNQEIQDMAGEDGLAAIRFARAHAKEWGIKPDRIAIGGFSAGGMLSSYAATRFDYGDPNAEEPLQRISSRPDAALILYGAMSWSGIATGAGQFDYKAQARKSEKDPIRNIRSDCPPMFVFQTQKDDPRHALQFCMELANHGVPFEIHTFEEGPHGGALYDGACEDSPSFPHTAMWAELAAQWLKERGF